MSVGQRWFVPGFLFTLLVLSIAVLQLPRAKRVTVPGIVTATQKPLRMVAPDGGVVTRLYVKQGEYVLQGQRLVSLSQPLLGADGRSAGDLKIAQLQAALAAQRSQLQLVRQSFTLRRAQLLSQRNHTLSRRSAARDQLEILQQREGLKASQLARSAGLLEAGHLSVVAAERLLEVQLQLASEVLTQRERVQGLIHEEQGLTRQLQTLQLERDLAVQRGDVQIKALSDDIARLRQDEVRVLVAPGAGEIVDLNIHPGAVLKAQQPVMTIAPEPRGRQLELALSPQVSALVRPGMDLRVRFAGYPYQDFGMARGVVVAVNRVATLDRVGMRYRAVGELRVVPSDIGDLPLEMPISADVLLAAKPLHDWLLEPLQALWGGV